MAKPLKITWRDELEPVRAEVELQIMAAGKFADNKLLAARALLTLLSMGEHPTANEVVDFVASREKLSGLGFDPQKWANYLPAIVAVLNSPNPLNVIHI